MPISQVTVTGSIRLPDNVAATVQAVRFTLSGFDTEDGILIAKYTKQANILPNGGFSVVLWPNLAGLKGSTTYTVDYILDNQAEIPGFPAIQIPMSTTPLNMENILVRGIFPGGYRIVVVSQEEFRDLVPAPMTIYYVLRPQ